MTARAAAPLRADAGGRNRRAASEGAGDGDRLERSGKTTQPRRAPAADAAALGPSRARGDADRARDPALPLHEPRAGAVERDPRVEPAQGRRRGAAAREQAAAQPARRAAGARQPGPPASHPPAPPPPPPP